MAQLVIVPNVQAKFLEVPKLSDTTRKGGFGSTNVNTVTNHPGKITFKGQIHGKNLDFLIDSGADGIFCGQNIATEAKMKLTKLAQHLDVTSADGQPLTVTHKAKEIPYSIQGYRDTMDIYVLPVDHEHILLGNHWLSKINPTIDWQKKEVMIQKKGQTYTLEADCKDKPSNNVNFLVDINDFTPNREDQLYLIQAKDDVDEELDIDDKYYEAQ
jgi:hypothetical protein